MRTELNSAGVRRSAACAPQTVHCLACDASLPFWRSRSPAIDSCGFESYRLDCIACGAPHTGIVDPADDALLLSLVPA